MRSSSSSGIALERFFVTARMLILINSVLYISKEIAIILRAYCRRMSVSLSEMQYDNTNIFHFFVRSWSKAYKPVISLFLGATFIHRNVFFVFMLTKICQFK